MEKKGNIVCFIHSCSVPLWGDSILRYLINYLKDSGLYDLLDKLIINNNGIPFDKKFPFDDKMILINYSNKIDLFETPTLKLLYFHAINNPNDKILYLHTKGVSYDRNHPWYQGAKDWTHFMLYCNVHHHKSCIELLDYVDVVGCNHRNQFSNQRPDPNHFSGNFWWANANYINKLSINELNGKMDAEWWLFKQSPTFINIHRCPFGHYENRYPMILYVDIVDNKINDWLYIVKNIKTLSILYGIEGKYLDVTSIVHSQVKNNRLYITGGDHQRNVLYSDPLPGTVKHIRISDIQLSFADELCLRF